MNGNRAYHLSYQHKVQRVLYDNPELQGFYSFMMSSNCSITTVYNYLIQIKSFMQYVKKPANELTIDDFTGYSLSKGIKADGDMITSSYKIQIYQALKKYGHYLTARGYITKNPMIDVNRPIKKDSQKTIVKRQTGYLEENEIKQYLEAVNNGVGSNRCQARQKEWKERDLAIIYIFLNTGIRASALYKLDITSIDWKKKILIVTDKGSIVKEHVLSDDTIKILYQWINKRKNLLNGKEEDALFISNQLQRISNPAVANIVKKYAVNINGKNITPHKLRATYGTQLYDKTKDIYFVQECMSHADPNTTQLYIRKKYDFSAEASNIMQDIMSK